MSDKILPRIEEILAEALDLERLTLTPETRLEDIANLDSFGIISLFMSIEGTFGVRFTIDDIGNMKTVGNILDGIAARLPAAGHP